MRLLQGISTGLNNMQAILMACLVGHTARLELARQPREHLQVLDRVDRYVLRIPSTPLKVLIQLNNSLTRYLRSTPSSQSLALSNTSAHVVATRRLSACTNVVGMDVRRPTAL